VLARPRFAEAVAVRVRSARSDGLHRGTIHGFFGVGEERAHARAFYFVADHPAGLVGRDNGSTPVEYVLHALAACLTAGLANIAAARGIRLTEVRSTVSGDVDLNGILGLSRTVRNGYPGITVHFTGKGDAPAEKLRELVGQSRARSASRRHHERVPSPLRSTPADPDRRSERSHCSGRIRHWAGSTSTGRSARAPPRR
jgi:uncharacterized OsmC-like protein